MPQLLRQVLVNRATPSEVVSSAPQVRMQLKKLSSTSDLILSSGTLTLHAATRISVIHVHHMLGAPTQEKNPPEVAAEDGNFTCLDAYML